MKKHIGGRDYYPLVIFRDVKRDQKAKQEYLKRLEKEKNFLIQDVLNRKRLGHVPCFNTQFLGQDEMRYENKRFRDMSLRELYALDVSTLNEMLFYPEEYFDIVKAMLTEQEKEVLIYRSQKYTLQDVGEKYALSRERIRQIQNNALKLLDYFTRNAAFYLFSKNGFLDLERLEDYFSSDNIKLIYFIFEQNDLFKYDDAVQKIIIDSEENDYILNTQINYLSSKDYVSKKDISNVLSYLEKKNIQYYDFHDIRKKLINERFYPVQTMLVKLNRVAAPYLYVIKTDYPDGIELKQVVETEDFKELIQKTSKRFPVDTSHVNVRQLVSRLTPELKAIDRSLWVHKEHFTFDRKLIHQIVDDLKKSPKESFYFPEIFNIYEKELREKGIHNRYHLRSALEEVIGDSFEMNRDVIKKTGSQFISLDQQIETYLKEKGKSVFLDHIKSAFEYHSETMVYFALTDSPNILRWGYSRYIHRDCVAPLQNYDDIVEILCQKYHHIPYFSVQSFIDIVNYFNDFSAYEINTKEDITYFLNFYFKDDFAYDDGVIWFVEAMPQDTITRIQSMLRIGVEDLISLDCIDDFSSEYDLSYNESRYLVETVFKHCVRKSKKTFYSPQVQFDQEALKHVSQEIRHILSSTNFTTIAAIYDHTVAPASLSSWTHETIASLLKKELSDEFDVFSIGPDKMLSTWGIVTQKGRYASMSEAIYAFFMDLGLDEIYEHELDQFLDNYKISPYGIPHEFYNNKYFPIVDGKIIMKKAFD